MLEISCISLDIKTICIFIRYSVFVFVFLYSLFWGKKERNEIDALQKGHFNRGFKA